MPKLATTTTTDLTTDARLEPKLTAYLDIQATLKRLQEEAAELLKDMKPLAFKAHLKGKALETDTHIVRYVEASSAARIDEAKLLKLVSAKQLAACKTPGSSYAYVGIYPKKVADDPAPTKKPRRG